jgi:hypothetical protein
MSLDSFDSADFSVFYNNLMKVLLLNVCDLIICPNSQIPLLEIHPLTWAKRARRIPFCFPVFLSFPFLFVPSFLPSTSEEFSWLDCDSSPLLYAIMLCDVVR